MSSWQWSIGAVDCESSNEDGRLGMVTLQRASVTVLGVSVQRGESKSGHLYVNKLTRG